MKSSHYFFIGVVTTLIIVGSLAFRSVTTSEEGKITITKDIESTDPSCLQLYYYIEQYADSFDIPINYAYGIAHVETSYNGPFDWNYDHRRVSPAGAVGPMQVMLSTANSINDTKVTKTKLKNDVEFNVMTSMKLLRILYDKYEDWELVFGAYNTGKPIVNKYARKVYNYKPHWIE